MSRNSILAKDNLQHRHAYRRRHCSAAPRPDSVASPSGDRSCCRRRDAGAERPSHQYVPRCCSVRYDSNPRDLQLTFRSISAGAEIRPPDLGETAARFLAALRSGGKPDVRDWNKDLLVPLWTTSPAIASEADAFDAVLARVACSVRARPYRQLAAGHLAEFAGNRPGLDRIATLLRLRAERLAVGPGEGNGWRVNAGDAAKAVRRLIDAHPSIV